MEYSFGYRLPENDLLAQDWRSRDQTWTYSRIALDFFREHRIPVAEMTNANSLIGNAENNNSGYCLAKPGALYLVYLRKATAGTLDLSGQPCTYHVQWFNPRTGGALVTGPREKPKAGSVATLGTPPADAAQDWVAIIRAH